MYNSSSDNSPNGSLLLAKMNSGTIWDNMDAELKAALETVKVKVSQGGGSSTQDTIIDWEGKLFLPREHDLFSSRYNSVQAEWDVITQDQYYQENNTDSARRKCRKTSSLGNDRYFAMSPYSGETGRLCGVEGEGYAGGYYTFFNSNSSFGVAVRFAL